DVLALATDAPKSRVSAALQPSFETILCDLRLEINLPSIIGSYRWLKCRRKSRAMTEASIHIASG
ncbi:hypothetical protein ACC771_18295, partial [Rhizobium ruizarguesonis]